MNGNFRVIKLYAKLLFFQGKNYLCIRHSNIHDDLTYCLKLILNEPGSRFSASDNNDYRFIYDRMINKGSILILTMNQLLNQTGMNTLLYTAGDDIFDLPMLRLNQASTPFEYEPVPDQLYDDLKPLGLSRSAIDRVIDTWRLGIVPADHTEALNF